MKQDDAIDFFAELYYGEHHFPAQLKPFGDGWSMTHIEDCSTFDFDFMTRLVFLAHDKCCRATIMQGVPRSIKICIWQRNTREGGMSERHPTISQALEKWREKHKGD